MSIIYYQNINIDLLVQFLVFYSFCKKNLPIVVMRVVCTSVCMSVCPSVCVSVCRAVRISVRLSFVAIISFRGNSISSMSIDLKVGLNVVRHGVVHVRKAWLFKILTASCKFKQFAIICKYICVHGFDLPTNTILLRIEILLCYTMVHVCRNRLF